MPSSHDPFPSLPRPVLPSDARGLIVEGTYTSIRAMFQSMKWGNTNARGASQYRQALRELFGLGVGAAPVASAE